MKVKELISLLKKINPNKEIFYRDMNFGGKSEPFKEENIDNTGEAVLIESECWTPVD